MVEEIEPRQPDLTPEINLLKGLAGPRSAAVIQYVQVVCPAFSGQLN